MFLKNELTLLVCYLLFISLIDITLMFYHLRFYCIDSYINWLRDHDFEAQEKCLEISFLYAWIFIG